MKFPFMLAYVAFYMNNIFPNLSQLVIHIFYGIGKLPLAFFKPYLSFVQLCLALFQLCLTGLQTGNILLHSSLALFQLCLTGF